MTHHSGSRSLSLSFSQPYGSYSLIMNWIEANFIPSCHLTFFTVSFAINLLYSLGYMPISFPCQVLTTSSPLSLCFKFDICYYLIIYMFLFDNNQLTCNSLNLIYHTYVGSLCLPTYFLTHSQCLFVKYVLYLT